MTLIPLAAMAAESSEGADVGLSFFIGGCVLALLLFLMGALLAFGGGREHS